MPTAASRGLKTVESFLQPVVIVLFAAYPGVAGIARDAFGDLGALWTAGEFALPFVLGLLIGRYWVTTLALSVAGWFLVDLARGRPYAVDAWHEHTGLGVVALAVLVAIFAAVLAFGVWLRRRFACPQGRDRVAEKLATKLRRRPATSSRVTLGDLRWFIAASVALFAAATLTTGIAARLLYVAPILTYVGGWFYVQRRAAKAKPATAE